MRFCLLVLLATSCTGAHITQDDDDLDYHETLPIIPDVEKKEETSGKIAQVFYLIQTGNTEDAITALLEAKESDPYIFHEGTLEKLGLALIEQGARSNDPQDIVTCLYGARISQDERTLPIVERALAIDDMQTQLVAVNVAASFDTEAATRALERGMLSNYFIVRLESAFWLSQKQAKLAHSQLVALMSKVDPEQHALFCKLFAIVGSQSSMQELKRLLFHEDQAVRREAILAIGDSGRDDFLPEIHTLSKEPSIAQQEACAYAMGQLGDEKARDDLLRLAASSSSDTRLAAHFALYKLGSQVSKDYIVEEAENGNCFAISILGSFASCGAELARLQESADVNVRVNATIALLEMKDRRALRGLADILIYSHRDYAFHLTTSHGMSLLAWKVTPSSSEILTKNPYFFELSLALREQVLASCLELSEDDFIEIAQGIFESGQTDLIPLTVRLLENLRSEKAILLLKEEQQRLGVPSTRAWCTLALYRMREEGPYVDAIRALLEKHEDKDVFQARPVLPWRMRPEETKHQLTLEESYALLIESFEALAMRQDEKGLEMLLKVIRDGNPHNRYTLAGLLMRSSI